MDASTIAAWWGAIVASIVLLWDIFKWVNRGAKVTVNASPNMQSVNQIEGVLNDDRIILVEALNSGDMATTITNLVFFQYDSLFKKLLKKPKKQGVILCQSTGHELPHLLEPGSRWVGQIDQNDVIDKVGTKGFFYCGVIHTARKMPVLVRVDVKNGNT